MQRNLILRDSGRSRRVMMVTAILLTTATLYSFPRARVSAAAEGQTTEEFARREAELRREVEVKERQLSSAELRLAAAKKRFDVSADPPPALLDEIEAHISLRDALQKEVEVLDKRIDGVESEKTIWRRRQSIRSSRVEQAEAEAWGVQATDFAREAALAERIATASAAELRKRHDTLDARLGELAETDPAAEWLTVRRQALEDLGTVLGAYLSELRSAARSNEQLLEEIEGLSGTGPLKTALRDLREAVQGMWSYEITQVDAQPITVATLVVALVLLLVGFTVSRRLSRALGRALKDHLKVDAGAATAMETLAFYVLLLGVTLFALRTVNFPLTAFAIAGGALAIGIGFGSQNVMNNFISGLILMLERPVRAGDLVQIEGTYGTVEHIGARSTRIRASDNTHIIVPNSFFLQSNVVNWTLSDDVIRAEVKVGVIYGSPTRTVEQLIRKALSEHPEILPTHEPRIVFADFGDNSLNFEAYFWIRARSMMERKRIESEVRYRIDDLFREAGLVIAFPQRDVHLDSVKPIDVRLHPSEPQDAAAE